MIYHLHSNEAARLPDQHGHPRRARPTIYDGGRSIELYTDRVAIELYSRQRSRTRCARRACCARSTRRARRANRCLPPSTARDCSARRAPGVGRRDGEACPVTSASRRGAQIALRAHETGKQDQGGALAAGTLNRRTRRRPGAGSSGSPISRRRLQKASGADDRWEPQRDRPVGEDRREHTRGGPHAEEQEHPDEAAFDAQEARPGSAASWRACPRGRPSRPPRRRACCRRRRARRRARGCRTASSPPRPTASSRARAAAQRLLDAVASSARAPPRPRFLLVLGAVRLAHAASQSTAAIVTIATAGG